MKKNSLDYILRLFSGFQILSVLLVFTGFAVFTYFDARQRTLESLNENLGIYKVQIENQLQRAEGDVYNILDYSVEFSRLLSTDNSERLRAQVSLKEILNNYATSGAGGDCYNVYSKPHDVYIAGWRRASNASLKEKMPVEQKLKEIYGESELNPGWNLQELGGEYFLFQTYKWQGRIIGVFIDVDTISGVIIPGNNPDLTYIFTDEAGNILKIKGGNENRFSEFTNINEVNGNSFINHKISIKNDIISLYAFSGNAKITEQLRTTSLFLGAALILIIITGLYFRRIIKNRIIEPMLEMERDMNSIKEGEYQTRIKEEGKLREFAAVAGAFNRLMTEIFDLKIESMKKKLALSEAELKYIRLQIKPHFFINALTSISSLSKKRKAVEIDKYIDSLTKNIRYMFKSGLHTVPLKEELYHVKNYFEMQELKYPGMVFYYIDLPEELSTWQIPQMLIHTVIENEYKYALGNEELLTIFIKINAVNREGEECLYIEIEDDGKGYPEDVIDYINGDYDESQSEGSRVGLYSLKRLLYLMYNESNLMEIGNADTHGAITRFWIPENPKEESLRINESIDS